MPLPQHALESSHHSANCGTPSCSAQHLSPAPEIKVDIWQLHIIVQQ